ncbi:MAG: HD domain-containing protein, partial [Pseudomonadota bacterium]
MGVNHPESAQRDQDLQSLIDASQTYQPEGDHKLLSDVWHFARKAHRGQHRLDGKAFFSHPVSVAHILSERKADIACLCAGLLHDVVEDTDVELADLRKAFGPEIATIVDGVTKLSKIEGRNLSQDEYTAHNLNKLVSAITSDVRVLVVKLADRMHNMRTIQVMKPEKQRRIAVETQDYYVPFARYIAIELWADELQELVFEILNPEGYQSIKRNLERHYQGSSNESAKAIRQKLEDDLKGFGIKAHVSGRMKAPYSIWLKMRTRKVSFQQLSDVMAFRVVIDNADDCYRVLGHLHRRYQLRPGR